MEDFENWFIRIRVVSRIWQVVGCERVIFFSEQTNVSALLTPTGFIKLGMETSQNMKVEWSELNLHLTSHYGQNINKNLIHIDNKEGKHVVI